MDSLITNTISVIFSLTGLTIITGTHIWLLVAEQVDTNMYITLASSNLVSCLSVFIGFLISQHSLQEKDTLIKTLNSRCLETSEVTVRETTNSLDNSSIENNNNIYSVS